MACAVCVVQKMMKKKQQMLKVENVMKIVGVNFYNFLDELFG